MNIFQKFTFRTLKENRTRTLVTIVGIMLSVAMLTAVTTSVSSVYNYMVNLEIVDSGNWHGAIYNMSQTDCDALADEAQIDTVGRLQNLGYASLTDADQTYLYVGGMDTAFAKQMSIHLTAGELPKDSSEIVLPEEALTALGGELGDTITIGLGQRQAQGVTLWQNDVYCSDEDTVEQLVNVEEKTYTVVGILDEQNALESYVSSAYTALTGYDETVSASYTCYLKMKDSGEVYDFLETIDTAYDTTTNESLLRFLGTSKQAYFNSSVRNLAAVLIGIIMIGSISMIYNAFSISVSERTKAFGLLSSIGATKKQMRRSVNSEVVFLCAVGVPLGIVMGIVGMTVTFRVLNRILTNYDMLTMDTHGVVLTMHPSWQALLIALLVGVLTVYISAWIPTHRALKFNTIDAIRQTQDVKIKSSEVKTSKLTSRLFGFEGMLASKNYKRNRRKYRATVASLFISVVLFISASAYQSYLTKSAEDIWGNAAYDVEYKTFTDMSSEEMEQMNRYISEKDDVDQAGYAKMWYSVQFAISQDNLNEEFSEFLKEEDISFPYNESQEMLCGGAVAFVADDEYEAYLKSNGFDVETYMDAEHPVALVKDQLRYIVTTNSGAKYYVGNVFQDIGETLTVQSVKMEMDGLDYSGSSQEEDGVYYCYGTGENEVKYKASDATTTMTLQTGERTDKTLFSVDLAGTFCDQIVLLYPYRAYDKVMSDLPAGAECAASVLVYKTQNHGQVCDDADAYGQEHDYDGNATDYQQQRATIRAMITILNIFAYGFVILISLIAMTNVFNTISTNIGLRRREFAMLKSVGMTAGGFNKMMNYECLLYGVKGLMYGLPVSFGVTWLIYRSVSEGIIQRFYVPWNSVIIAVLSVFIVVFATMLYAMHKIKRENPMDVLKNDNF
jgi:putative ABC transport system permease protein